MAAISNTTKLARESSPIYKEAVTLMLPLEQCLEGFCCNDPPAIPQLALPAVSVAKECLHMAQSDPQNNLLLASADLAILAFYYLLRVGEYT
eukprot:1758327-Ditylum_brightwellii.AAC.1